MANLLSNWQMNGIPFGAVHELRLREANTTKVASAKQCKNKTETETETVVTLKN